MKKTLHVAFFSLLGVVGLNSQNCDIAIETSLKSLCNGDTLLFFQQIDTLLDVHPCKSRQTSCYFVRSLVYSDQMKFEYALNDVLLALQNYQKPEDFCAYFETCDWLFDMLEEQCDLNKMILVEKAVASYLHLNRAAEAINFLDKNSHSEEANFDINAIISIETNLAMLYADCYVALGDTLSALKKLSIYSVFNEAFSTPKLYHSLNLLTQNKMYKSFVTQELKEAILNAKEYDRYGVEMYIFGQKVPHLNMGVVEFQGFIKGNSLLNQYLAE